MAGRRPPRRRIAFVDLTEARGEPAAPTTVDLRTGATRERPPPQDTRATREPVGAAPRRRLVGPWSGAPIPTAVLLRAPSRPTRIGTLPRQPQSHEVLRYVFMDPAVARSHLGGWRPSNIEVPGASYEIRRWADDFLQGDLRRPMRRSVELTASLESRSDTLVCLRLTPDLGRRRYAPPTRSWWRIMHPIATAIVAVVKG